MNHPHSFLPIGKHFETFPLMVVLLSRLVKCLTLILVSFEQQSFLEVIVDIINLVDNREGCILQK